MFRRVHIEIRAEKPIFALDFWNDGPYVQGCIAGARRYFHVNAKGDVEPCVYTHIATDNIMEKPLSQALNSRLFREIRSCQPHNDNHLRPCMIIDNPEVMRSLIAKTGARYTHPGAEEIYTTYRQQLDLYARNWGILADRIWEKEYLPAMQEDERQREAKK